MAKARCQVFSDTTTPAPQPLAVNAKQLGAMLGLSVRTIRTMDAAGKLPKPVKLNAHAVRWILDGPNGIRVWLQAGAPDRATWELLCRNGRPER